jgi:DNA-binding PadR family transcriptional regulator
MGKNELAILGLLSEGEKYGYQIHQQISERSMDVWAKISISSIYNTLNKLGDQGMVSARKMKVGKTPERHIYRITPAGERMLADLVEKFMAKRGMGEYPFGLGVAFMYALSKERVQALLSGRIDRLGAELRAFDERIRAAADPMPPHWALLYRNGRNHIQTELEWCRGLLEQLEVLDGWREDAYPRQRTGSP